MTFLEELLTAEVAIEEISKSVKATPLFYYEGANDVLLYHVLDKRFEEVDSVATTALGDSAAVLQAAFRGRAERDKMGRWFDAAQVVQAGIEGNISQRDVRQGRASCYGSRPMYGLWQASRPGVGSGVL